MKVISVVGTKKTGKTTLVCALVSELARHGRVGTIKNMATHQVDRGDTGRHFDAGADVVVEGFKHSDLAKIVMGELDSPNLLRRIDLADLNHDLVRDLADMVRHMQDYASAK